MGVVLDFAALWSLIRRPRIWWFVSTPARNRSPCIDGVGRVPDTERNRGQFDDLRECLVGHGLVSVPLLLEPSTCHPLALPGDPPPAPGPGLVGPDLAAIAPSSDRDILRSRSTLLPLPLNGTTSVRRIFYNRIALRKFPIIVRCKAIPHPECTCNCCFHRDSWRSLFREPAITHTLLLKPATDSRTQAVFLVGSVGHYWVYALTRLCILQRHRKSRPFTCMYSRAHGLNVNSTRDF
jgi:hypothetical protein